MDTHSFIADPNPNSVDGLADPDLDAKLSLNHKKVTESFSPYLMSQLTSDLKLKDKNQKDSTHFGNKKYMNPYSYNSQFAFLKQGSREKNPAGTEIILKRKCFF